MAAGLLCVTSNSYFVFLLWSPENMEGWLLSKRILLIVAASYC